MNYTKLGKRIREARFRKHLTQNELAELINYSEKHVGNVETAKTKPSLEFVVKVANVLEVSLDDLLFDSLDNKEYLKRPEYKKLLEDYTPEKLNQLIKVADRIADIVKF